MATSEAPARPTPPEFIEAWQTSGTLAEVASKLRMSKPQCRVRAYRYRQRGVPLKEFPPAEVLVWNWEWLADYAESLVAEGDGSESEQDANEPGAAT